MSRRIALHDITPPAGHGPGSVDLYAARKKIHTKAFSGLFRNVRMIGGALLLLLYFGTVWLDWNNRQAVWWDLPQRQFHIFGTTFWPQDFILLSGLLIVAAFGLFFITVYAGRVWCGYTCPQSVWTWIFMWCEKVTEGDRHQRIRLDNAPMSARKLLRKTAKHSLWLLIALATGVTFVGYFSPIGELCLALVTGTADGWAYFWVGVLTLATYANAGWLREQVCVYMCPYARFQSVMFDKDTLIVSYDPRRGEPRGTRRQPREPETQGTGDCIDCTLCVQVCPTGIDIREGLQIECIGCAACIDACNTVMDKLNAPRDLIRYTTEHHLAGQATRTLRPRLIGYAVALLLMSSLLACAFMLRPLTDLEVSKDRMLYRETAQGHIENVYSLNVLNKDPRAHTYRLQATGLPDLHWQGPQTLVVPGSTSLTQVISLSVPPDALPAGSNEVTFTAYDINAPEQRIETASRFTGPQVRQ